VLTCTPVRPNGRYSIMVLLLLSVRAP